MSMKLKAIVASLVTLGLSGPVLAMQPYMMDPSFQRDVMRYQVNKIDMILDRNQPGGFDQPCGWTCRINVSGWMNTDVYLANDPPVFWRFNPGFNSSAAINPAANPPNVLITPTSGRASDLLLNNANLFVDARVNNWVTANMSVVYSSLSPVPGSTGPYQIANSLLVYHPLNRTAIDTAYATIGNFTTSPIYFRVGKEYIPFDSYDPYGFVTQENPTQLLSEITAPAAQLGFVAPMGLYGSLYTLAGKPTISDGGSIRRIRNGGVDLGWTHKWCGGSKFNVDAGYIANIEDSNFLSSYYFNSLVEGTVVPGLPNTKVPAWNVNAEITVGPFDANGHYIETTRSLPDPFFLSGNSAYGFTVLNPPPAELGKPKVWGLEAGLTFPVMAHQSRVAIGYQHTTHLATLLPQRRIYADYMVNFAKWFDVGLAVFQDRDYSSGENAIVVPGTTGTAAVPSRTVHPGATGNKATTGQLRFSIKFA
jgi:hypothetical protein